MRSVDERVAAVRRRERRLRRKRDSRALAIILFLVMLPLVDLAGRSVSSGLITPTPSNEELFGAASLLGSSAGGYVLVAVISFAVAVLITVILMLRRRAPQEGDEVDEAFMSHVSPDGADAENLVNTSDERGEATTNGAASDEAPTTALDEKAHDTLPHEGNGGRP